MAKDLASICRGRFFEIFTGASVFLLLWWLRAMQHRAKDE